MGTLAFITNFNRSLVQIEKEKIMAQKEKGLGIIMKKLKKMHKGILKEVLRDEKKIRMS